MNNNFLKMRTVYLLREINFHCCLIFWFSMIYSVGLFLPILVGLTMLANAGVETTNKSVYKLMTNFIAIIGFIGSVDTVSTATIAGLVLGDNKKFGVNN